MPSFYALLDVPSTGFDAEHRFFTSWSLPPLVLAVWRLLFALFGWADLFAVFGYDGIHDPGAIGPQFSFFTDLTWWGITCYMTIASIHTFVYAARGHTWLERWWWPLQALHSLFYTTIVTFPFLVTIVYWAILYSGPWFPTAMEAFTNVSIPRQSQGEVLNILADLSTRSKFSGCFNRDYLTRDQSSSLVAYTLAYCTSCSLLGPGIHHTRYSGLLSLRLPRSIVRAWSTGGLHFWHRSRVCGNLLDRMGTDMAKEEIHRHRKTKQKRWRPF